jgi:hypothetical protein
MRIGRKRRAGAIWLCREAAWRWDRRWRNPGRNRRRFFRRRLPECLFFAYCSGGAAPRRIRRAKEAAKKERGARQLTGASFTHSFKVNRTSLDHLLLGEYADIDMLSTAGIISPLLGNSRARFRRRYGIGLTGIGPGRRRAKFRRTGAVSRDCRRRAMTARRDPWCQGFGLAAGPNPGK